MALPETAQRVLSSALASGVALGLTGSQLYDGGAGGRAGAAEESKPPADRYDEARVHRERW